MPIERLKPKYIFDEQKIEELKQIAPEAFADGKINWKTLQEALGNYVEEDGQDREHFGLFWHGKREARRLASIPSKGTLVPVPGEGIDEQNTHNIFIEGENLEVLKLMQKTYAGKIKMMYFDPPYNTGNDFVYEDDFKEPLEEYLRRTEQSDEEGKLMTTNSRADGRFHSKWLSMMYPRLRLARNLLRDDGVIFISIDDNEVHNLRHIMNETFGEENFLGEIITIANPGGRDYLQIAQQHEYIIVFGKSEDSKILELSKEHTNLNYEDNKGSYQLRELRNRNPRFNKDNRPNLYYPFYINDKIKDNYNCCAVSTTPKDGYSIQTVPLNSKGAHSVWRWGVPLSTQNIIEDDPSNSQVVARQKRTGGWNIYEKNRRDTSKVKSVWDETEMRTEDGTRRIRELFGYTAFDHPKSVALIKKILDLSVEEFDLTLDCFAGSGTTGEAVLQWVAENNKELNYILIQAAEQIDASKESFKNGLHSISEITKKRLKFAQKDLKPKFSGFKVYKLSNSNYRQWQNYEGTEVKELENKYDLFTTPLIEDWKEDDLLYEIMLIEGFPLDSTIEELKDYKKNKVKKVSSDFCEHSLLVSLDEQIKKETIEGLKLKEGDIFVCLDSAIMDEDKVKLADKR